MPRRIHAACSAAAFLFLGSTLAPGAHAHGSGYAPPPPDQVPPVDRGGGPAPRSGTVLGQPYDPGGTPTFGAPPPGGSTFPGTGTRGGVSGVRGGPGSPWIPGAPGVPALDVEGYSEHWELWWRINRAPHLRLKEHVHAAEIETGIDGWFLGRGGKVTASPTLKPTEEIVRGRIVPALITGLSRRESSDVVTACLIALAKIGDTDGGASELAPILATFLSSANQEERETAAVALGILAHPATIGVLGALLGDTARGRELTGSNEVDYRTRSFAAYGLGLTGARAEDPRVRRRVADLLRKTLETDESSARDLSVACVIASGLVPLDAAEGQESPGARQLDSVLAYFADETNDFLARAHCPTTLVRLLSADRLPIDLRAEYFSRSQK